MKIPQSQPLDAFNALIDWSTPLFKRLANGDPMPRNVLVLLDPEADILEGHRQESWGTEPSLIEMSFEDAISLAMGAWERTGIPFPPNALEMMRIDPPENCARLLVLVHQLVVHGAVRRSAERRGVFELGIYIHPKMLALATPDMFPRAHRVLTLQLTTAIREILASSETQRETHVILAMDPKGWLMTNGKTEDELRVIEQTWGSVPFARLISEEQAKRILETIDDNVTLIEGRKTTLPIPRCIGDFRLLCVSDRSMSFVGCSPQDPDGINLIISYEYLLPHAGAYLISLASVDPSRFGNGPMQRTYKFFIAKCRAVMSAAAASGKDVNRAVVEAFGGREMAKAYAKGPKAVGEQIGLVLEQEGVNASEEAPPARERAPKNYNLH